MTVHDGAARRVNQEEALAQGTVARGDGMSEVT